MKRDIAISRKDYVKKRNRNAALSHKKQKTHRNNGQGIIKYRQDRKNPYMALVSVGTYYDKKEKLQCRYRSVGSYATRVEAEKALAEYVTDPIDLSSRIRTFSDLYNAWYKYYSEKGFSDSYMRTIRSAYSYCGGLYDEPINSIGPGHIKDVMKYGYIVVSKRGKVGVRKYASDGVKESIKSMCNLMFDYALERNLVRRNPSRLFDIKDIIERIYENTKRKKPFDDSHVKLFWENLYLIDHIDMIIVGIYTGFRPKELCLIEVENVNLDKMIIIGGMKTSNGKDRIVPIHPRIYPLIKTRLEEAINVYQSKYLFNLTNSRGKRPFSYDVYRHLFCDIMEELGLEGYSPHCTRHTFATQAELCDMKPRAMKLIMGHSQKLDVTNDVYVHTGESYLYNEMVKLRFEGDEAYE